MHVGFLKLELILRELKLFELSHLGNILHSKVSLCDQLLLRFSMDLFKTLHTC